MMSSNSELLCTRKNGCCKMKDTSDHRKVKWKNQAPGSIPGSRYKKAYKYVRKTVQYTQTSYRMLTVEEAPRK